MLILGIFGDGVKTHEQSKSWIILNLLSWLAPTYDTVGAAVLTLTRATPLSSNQCKECEALF